MQNKKRFSQAILVAFFPVFLAYIISFSSQASSKANQGFEDEGRPGRRKDGGSRDPNCPFIQNNKSLTALVPKTNSARTLQERPAFWFYLPYDATNLKTGEFILQDDKDRDIYRVPFRVPEKPGIISVSHPQNKKVLGADTWYRWYFKLYCNPQKSSYLYLEGWIKPIEKTASIKNQLEAATDKKYTVYWKQYVWYDTLDALAQRRLEEPENKHLLKDWIELLQLVELEEISQEPVVGRLSLLHPDETGEPGK